MSRTRWPGLTWRSSGGTIDTSSCRDMLPSSTSVVRNSWKAARRCFEASSVSVGGGGSSPSAPRRVPLPRSVERETSNLHESRAGSHGMGYGGGTVPTPGTVRLFMRETWFISM
eukprot:scaffold101816_cov29-Tisochrysis_lutea.AAC.5